MVETNEAEEAILSILDEGRNTPSNIARRADYTREYVAQRLKRLVENDVVVRVDRGLYGLAENERREERTRREVDSLDNREDEPLEAGFTDANPRGETPETTLQNEESTNEPADDVEDSVDLVANDTLPGSGRKLEERRDALRAVYEYLREADGPVTPSMFRRDVYPNHEAHYTKGEEPARSWWKNCIYPGLKELAKVDDSIVVADYSGEWSYNP